MMATRLALFLILCIIPTMSVNQFEPVKLAPLTTSGNQGVCPSGDLREEGKQNLSTTVQGIITTQLVQSPDSDHLCGPGSWRRVAFLNMTDPAQQCPTQWALYDANIDRRSCIRPSGTTGCVSNYFTTGSLAYDRVCGRADGIGFISPDSYRLSSTVDRDSWPIDDPYVDGLSVTHGSPRQHIWTFVADYTAYRPVGTPPPYVGNDYFCDAIGGGNLWDGIDCPGSACCAFNSPPWFHKNLSRPVTDDIEVRICLDEINGNENVGIKLLEVYVD